jgi:hypothetical protein
MTGTKIEGRTVTSVLGDTGHLFRQGEGSTNTLNVCAQVMMLLRDRLVSPRLLAEERYTASVYRSKQVRGEGYNTTHVSLGND